MTASIDSISVHQQQLFAIKELLRTRTALPFDEFIRQVLYDPALGYYSSQSRQFGAEGDFITAPELSPIFGWTLAEQCHTVLQSIADSILLELGAGSGKLAISILQALEKKKALPKQYFILEVSAALRERQRAAIDLALPHLSHKVVFLDALPAGFKGVIVANEVMDAMPFKRFAVQSDDVHELGVALNEQGKLFEMPIPASPALKTFVSNLKIDSSPYVSEYIDCLPAWINSLSEALSEGVIFLIDYGFVRSEYYHPDRDTGTLMCHHRHKASPDPFQHLGEQDITCHVDFTAVAESAVNAGFSVLGFTTQAAFLLANDLLRHAESAELDDATKLSYHSAIKLLTLPQEMGELFKVMALGKAYQQLPLEGFSLMDYRHRL